VIKVDALSGRVRLSMENGWGSAFDYIPPEEAEKLGRRLVRAARQARTKQAAAEKLMMEDHGERPGVHEEDRLGLGILAQDCPACMARTERGA
jgi:hypothetical protein